MKVEQWKDIKGHEELYQVSNFGNVKSLGRDIFNKDGVFIRKTKDKILKSGKSGNDGYKVVLCNNDTGKARYVNRLVAEYFLDGYSENKEVGHLDGDKTNNNVDNLFISDLDVSHNPVKKLYKYDLSKYEVEIKNNHIYIKEL